MDQVVEAETLYPAKRIVFAKFGNDADADNFWRDVKTSGAIADQIHLA